MDEWNQFFATGKIQDYLVYRNGLEQEQVSRDDRWQEREDEPDDEPGEGYRDGSFH